MKFLKYLLYAVLGFVVLIVLLGLFAKKTYHVERSIEIDAPRHLVWDQVRHFKNFTKWQPWNDLDPNMQITYEGVDGEVGAAYAWKGTEDVGEGKEVIKKIEGDRIDLEISFKEPFQAVSPVFFQVTGDSMKTKVSWGMDTNFPFPINAWAMFTDINKAMGADYERGLGNLKKLCEGIAHPKYKGYEVVEMDMPVRYFVGLRKEVPITDISAFFQQNLPLAMSAVQENAMTPDGPPCTIVWSYNDSTGLTDMAAVVPVTAAKKLGDGIGVFTLGGRKALKIDYHGQYDSTGLAHAAMEEYLSKKMLTWVPPAIEEYVTDTAKEPDTTKWLTRIYYFAVPKSDSLSLNK
ncbi:MAG: SRPBCC family protein [Saprospiraceae bacterium]|nr:SRPBCC family protein [Saprospiraceae bacterium]